MVRLLNYDIIMIIDFSEINPVDIDGFKGGKGILTARNYVDEQCKIMKHVLAPGASTGLHRHEGNCEIIFVLSGEATIHYDGKVEKAVPGQVHYCPEGHSHYMENLTDKELVYFAVVPELR